MIHKHEGMWTIGFFGWLLGPLAGHVSFASPSSIASQDLESKEGGGLGSRTKTRAVRGRRGVPEWMLGFSNVLDVPAKAAVPSVSGPARTLTLNSGRVKRRR